MSERPFMQLYVSDFVGDTLRLSAELVGAYMLLLMAMWNGDGTLENDAAELSLVARIPADRWPTTWAKLAPFFDVADTKISHGRVALEMQKFARKSLARAEAGSRGGKAKALKDKNATLAIASRLPQHLPETRIKKRAKDSNPTEDSGIKLDRWADEALFKACERIAGSVPDYQQFKTWPAEIVAQAKASA